MRPKLEALREGLIAKIKAIDPTYVAKEVKPVSAPGCGAMLAVLLVLGIVGFAILMLLAKLSKG
ncbi:MAG: hypothetical protein HYV09_10810 [Deltaproteobacteria bacterium]|nr:hypothetical protein [Deltaproteobacteria bacterium]